jgi:dGTPase
VSRLSRLRFPVERTLGRRYPELAHPYRNDFERDRDRVVDAPAFRRLENKTQVFTQGISDHFRTRLTHTFEVTQISRTVAGVLELNADLAETLALVHDIGHPPFAHAGEEELDRQMRRYGQRFDHNLHALRIVEHFEHRYARFPGLNLTFEVREGIVKHSRDLQPGEDPALEEYLPGQRPPLEAQLIDLADEIAYNTSDLDDGYAASLFRLDEIREAVPVFNRFFEEMEGQFPGASERVRFNEVVRGLIDWLVSGLINGTLEAAQAAGVERPEDIRLYPRRLAGFTAETQSANRELKQFLHHCVYFSKTLVAERRRSREMIAELFQYLLERPETLPQEYREFSVGESPERVVCDYIAGMTDGFFHRTYAATVSAGLG